MEIEIVSIDEGEIVRIGPGETLGYRGSFKHRLASGQAIFVPDAGKIDQLVPGITVFVETGQASVRDFIPVSSNTVSMMEQLLTPGDYSVVGRVVGNTDNQVFDIDVCGLSFALDDEDTGGLLPDVNQQVSFVIQKLSFWVFNV